MEAWAACRLNPIHSSTFVHGKIGFKREAPIRPILAIPTVAYIRITNVRKKRVCVYDNNVPAFFKMLPLFLFAGTDKFFGLFKMLIFTPFKKRLGDRSGSKSTYSRI